MKVNKNEIIFEIPEEWLDEADFSFEPNGRYHYEYENNKDIFLVSICDVSPNIRGENVPIFNNGESDGVIKTARDRTVSILRAIRLGAPLPPIKVVALEGDN